MHTCHLCGQVRLSTSIKPVCVDCLPDAPLVGDNSAEEIEELLAAMQRLKDHSYYPEADMLQWASLCPTTRLQQGKIQEDKDTILLLRFVDQQLGRWRTEPGLDVRSMDEVQGEKLIGVQELKKEESDVDNPCVKLDFTGGKEVSIYYNPTTNSLVVEGD